MNASRILAMPAAGLALLAGLWLGWAPAATAGGLSCSIGEVVIDNLKIGHTYSLQTLANLPLAVTNTGDQSVKVMVDALVPGEGDLRRGAEPVPAAAWAFATPASFQLAPQQTERVELNLVIPDDESLLGRKFEVIFWSHTEALPGDMMAYGIKSRIIFSVDRERELPGVVPAGDLSVNFRPARITLDNITVGREYRLGETERTALTVENTSSKPLAMELRLMSPESASAGSDENVGDLLGSAEVNLSPAKFTLAPGEKKQISGTVRFPKRKGIRGKTYMCVVSAAVVDLPVATQIYSRIYASVK
ncbi:MAG: hypothetical protein A2V63_00325 [Candidatus Eisenbacteria bacterium RBG_19FT_COMBO_70_11]|nr:MAG: hypothetical protein A2V63_00325 [Candidatus Eisenbacteria bacterium RBG_19FT_COMBO_70_11]